MTTKTPTAPFYQFPKQVADDNTIKMSDRFCFMFLSDRKRLSATKGKDYYDKAHGDYYIIYSQEEMANKLGVSTKTVSRIYERLERLGLIIREDFARSFNAPKKIFLPSFFISTNKTKVESEPDKSSAPEQTKGQTSNNELNKNKPSESTTFNTVNTNRPEEDEEFQGQEVSTKEVKKSAIDSWIHSVRGKVNLDKLVIQTALRFTNHDPKKCFKLLGLILTAKKSVVNTYDLSPNDPITRFESNENLGKPLAEKIIHAFTKAPLEPSENVKYLMTCFKNFFENAFGLIKHDYHTPEMLSYNAETHEYEEDDGPDIPLFNIVTGEPVDPCKSYDWYTEEDEEDGPDIPIFKIQ